MEPRFLEQLYTNAHKLKVKKVVLTSRHVPVGKLNMAESFLCKFYRAMFPEAAS